MDDFDVEIFHKAHDSGHEWDLRRAFILAHRENFAQNRLLCLANCFVNVECYGCRYPAAVMKQLDELGFIAKKGVEKNRPVIGSLPSVKFVKSLDDKDTSNKTNEKNSPFVERASKRACTKSGGTFPEQLFSPSNSKNSGASDSSVERSAMEAKFYSLASRIIDLREKTKSTKNDAELVQLALDKTKMVATSKFTDCTKCFRCDLLIDCIFVATGESTTKKGSKHMAFQKAIEVFRKPYLRIEEAEPDDLRLVGSVEPFEPVTSPIGSPLNKHHFHTGIMKLGKETKTNIQSLAKHQKGSPSNAMAKHQKGSPSNAMTMRKRSGSNLDDVLEKFVVLERVAANATCIIQQSASMCHVELHYEYSDLPEGKCRCKVMLDNFVVIDVIGDSRATAKVDAAERALKAIKQKCHTIIIKQGDDTDIQDVVQRETVIGTPQNLAIPESNLGNRLLKKIGWLGGGLGKEGNEGIVEPISLNSVINREGLGLGTEKGISKGFAQKISRTIEEYIQSEKQEDLVFSPAFTKEERAIIHKQAQKYKLWTRSYGMDDDRYLVLRRKMTPAELVLHLQANGGETVKYILKHPEMI